MAPASLSDERALKSPGKPKASSCIRGGRRSCTKQSSASWGQPTPQHAQEHLSSSTLHCNLTACWDIPPAPGASFPATVPDWEQTIAKPFNRSGWEDSRREEKQNKTTPKQQQWKGEWKIYEKENTLGNYLKTAWALMLHPAMQTGQPRLTENRKSSEAVKLLILCLLPFIARISLT